MTDESNINGYRCPYCGVWVTGSGHTCNLQSFVYESTELQLLRQILNELQIIEKLLEKELK
jgi:hypothetical protein